MLPKINSGHGSDTRNVINNAIEVLDRLGIDVQTLVAEGQLTPAQYTELITVVNGMISKGNVSVGDINKNKGLLDSTFFTSYFLEELNKGEINATNVLPGSITTSEMADKAVLPNKTSFANQTKNLFNKDNVVVGRLDGNTGDVDETNSGWRTSGYIPIEIGGRYKRSHLSSVVQYDSEYNVLTSLGANDGTFTGVSRASYIRLSVGISNLNIYQLEKGEETTDYEDYGIEVESLIGVVSEEKASENEAGKLLAMTPLKREEYPDELYDILPEYEAFSFAGSEGSKDPSTAWRGHSYGIKISIPDARTSQMQAEFQNALHIPHVQAVSMWFYVEDPDSIEIINLELGHQESGHQWSRGHTRPLKKGWNLYRQKAISGIIGDWEKFYRLRLTFVANKKVDLTLGAIILERPEKAKLLFVQDGGYVEFLNNGYQDLKTRGIPTTWALNPGRLGEGRIITEAQVDELANDYMSSFSFHSWASEPHSGMTTQEVADNAIKCVRWLQRKGLKPDHLYRAAITQNNAPNHEVLQEIVEAYASHNGSAALEIFPFSNPYGTPRVTLHGSSDIDDYFNMMKKTHSLMIGYTHGVGESSSGQGQLPTDITQEKWDYFIQKIDEGISEGWLEGVTYEQLRKRNTHEFRGVGIHALTDSM